MNVCLVVCLYIHYCVFNVYNLYLLAMEITVVVMFSREGLPNRFTLITVDYIS